MSYEPRVKKPKNDGPQGEETRRDPGANARESRRERAAADALRALIRDYASARFGHFPEDRDLLLNIGLRVRPQERWDLVFDPPLGDQLRPQVEAAEADHDIYQTGRVYCFRCKAAGCKHAAPSSPLDVFQGYDALGSPQWNELAQVYLDLGEERVDLLFEEPASLVARMVSGRSLRARQLRPFGRASQTYALLGQVVAGYFPIASGTGTNRDRLAITYQAVAVRDSQGRTSLELNTLCGVDGHFSEIAARGFPWEAGVRKQASDDLGKLAEAVRSHETQHRGGEARRLLKRVPSILRKLATALEQGDRRTRRRTQHATQRRALRRPVDKAMADLRRARPERMYLDLKTRAIAVCGDRGRCHIFNDDGRHITSFTIKAEAIQIRLRKRRWAPLEMGQSNAFLQRALPQSFFLDRSEA